MNQTTDDVGKVHERIDLVLDKLTEVRADTARIDERSKATDKKIEELCKRGVSKGTVENMVSQHALKCPERNKRDIGFVEGGFRVVREHPIISFTAMALTALQVIREAGLL